MKNCTICKIAKDLTEFYKCKTTKDKHWGQCKMCAGMRSKILWASKSDEYKVKSAQRTKQLRKLRRKEHLLNQTRQRSIKNNIPFNLELSDICIPDVCPYLGIPLFHGEGKLSDNSPSIDKIVPELGYIKGNIQIISHKANSMKRNATQEELLAFARHVIDKFGDK